MSKSFDVSDEEARSDEREKALGVMKCQEASTKDETAKVEESEPAGLATGGKRWEFCKRLAKGDEIYEEVASDKDKLMVVNNDKSESGQLVKEKKKWRSGRIFEAAESAKHIKANSKSGLRDEKDSESPTRIEENNNTSEAQQPSSSAEALSSALSNVHISSSSPRQRSRRGDGQGYARVRERRRAKSKIISPEPKEVPMKNAVMMLNEMFPPPGAAQYKVLSMTGAPNNPTFLMVCCIEGQEFEGSGRSKKEAKLAASQLALSTLFGKVTCNENRLL